jgi:hypothetical protein
LIFETWGKRSAQAEVYRTPPEIVRKVVEATGEKKR